MRKYSFFLVICMLFLVLGCSQEQSIPNEVATLDHPALSPSGKYQLEVVEGYDGVVHYNLFLITDPQDKKQSQSPRVLYSSPDKFRTRDTLFFLWDKEDRVWVYSGDLGTFIWSHISDSEWKKENYIKNNYVVPDYLKIQRPKYFN